MKYVLNVQRLKKGMLSMGVESFVEFSKRSAIHRNTLLGYLSGKSVFPNTFMQIANFIGTEPTELIIPASESNAEVANIEELKFIIASLTKGNKDIAVLLIGSRAKGKEKKYSDWDIGITGGGKPITSLEYLNMKNVVEELSEDLPRMVDLVNLDSAPAWFLRAIDYEPVFLDGNKESYIYFKGVLYGAKKQEQA